MNNYIKFFKRINLKSIYFNLKYLPFKDAIKFPIIISNKVFLLKTKGTVTIDAPIKTGMIQIGFGEIGIFDMKRSRSIWQVSGKVIFKGKTNIGHGSKISINKDAEIEFGENFIITAESEIVSERKIRFGKNVLISWDCLIMDTDFHKIYDNTKKLINSPEPIIIGDKVWIGCRNVILKGSQISNNSIIGANSFLNKDITNQSGIYAGNPIKFIKGDVTWET
ncbi:acyltransferase [Polaribacter sp. MSW13]|uniref:Acyltransferase n=1 Tax=Polaribacter marinus TaxID=2916838 RepID=A0A9X2AKN8_9FLAO|nr:acyltransferase [Polaribacter marinus]MCI2230247.1 acyltransferase [Polaribacter marinus]